MLRNLKELKGYVLAATDGDIGHCEDFLFDREYLAVRYMVADTGKWLPGRRVLISPVVVGTADWRTRRVPVDLAKHQIENSPPLLPSDPITRRYEASWHDHFGWNVYWGGPQVWGAGLFPGELGRSAPTAVREDIEPGSGSSGEPQVTSMNGVLGFKIAGTDGDLGELQDLIVDDGDWRLQYLVVDTRPWLPGGHVLISSEWLWGVQWAAGRVEVKLTRDQIKGAPSFDPSDPVNAKFEVRAYDYLGRPHDSVPGF